MDFEKLWNLDISEIRELTDSNDLVIAMSSWLGRKTNYGENMTVLSPEEKTFLVCNHLEGEVNNGGFSQYFYNSSGNNANRVAECMEAIGAIRTAEICRAAIAAFPKPLPEDREEREEFLDEFLTEDVEEILEECDSAFYDYEDDLEQLTYAYIQAHMDCFT